MSIISTFLLKKRFGYTLKPNAHEFGEKELRSWWIEKDYLDTSNEKYISSSDMSQGDIIEMFIKDMNIE